MQSGKIGVPTGMSKKQAKEYLSSYIFDRMLAPIEEEAPAEEKPKAKRPKKKVSFVVPRKPARRPLSPIEETAEEESDSEDDFTDCDGRWVTKYHNPEEYDDSESDE